MAKSICVEAGTVPSNRRWANATWAFGAEALDSLDQARSDTEAYRNRFSMQGGSSNLTLEQHKARARESFARLQVWNNLKLGRSVKCQSVSSRTVPSAYTCTGLTFPEPCCEAVVSCFVGAE